METKSAPPQKFALFGSEEKVRLFASEEKVPLFANEEKVEISLPIVQGYIASAFNTFSQPARFFVNMVRKAAARQKREKSSRKSSPEN